MALLPHVECIPRFRFVDHPTIVYRTLKVVTDWNSAVLTLRFWISDDKMPSYAWALIFFVVFSVMTLLGVRAYGEIEYYFGMFKFGSLIVLFILSIVANAGGFGGDYLGFRYWKKPTGKQQISCSLD